MFWAELLLTPIFIFFPLVQPNWVRCLRHVDILSKQTSTDSVLSCSALRRLRGCEVQSSELDEILQEQAEIKGMRPSRPWDLFTDRSVRWQLISVIVISSAMQLCGNDSVRKASSLTGCHDLWWRWHIVDTSQEDQREWPRGGRNRIRCAVVWKDEMTHQQFRWRSCVFAEHTMHKHTWRTHLGKDVFSCFKAFERVLARFSLHNDSVYKCFHNLLICSLIAAHSRDSLSYFHCFSFRFISMHRTCLRRLEYQRIKSSMQQLVLGHVNSRPASCV